MLNNTSAINNWSQSLIRPFEGVSRMPSPVPIPTCVLSDRQIMNATTTTGDMAILFDPQKISPAQDQNVIYVLVRSTSTGDINFYSTLSAYGHIQSATGASYTSRTIGLTPTVVAYAQQYRVTSAGIRIRYLGTELNKSGQFRICRMFGKNQASANNFPTYSNVVEGQNTACVKVGSDSTSFWIPYNIDDFNFKSLSEETTTSAIVIYGAGLTIGAVFEIEYIINYEYIPTVAFNELLGSNAVSGPSTNSEVLSSILNSVSSVSTNSSYLPNMPRLSRLMEDL